MKLAVISDIHGNYLALEKVISKIKLFNVDKILFLGDSVGYLCYPNEVISLLIENNIQCIKGNHEQMLLGELEYNKESEKIYQHRKTMRIITPSNLDYMSKWQTKLEFQFSKSKIMAVHGSPDDIFSGYIYPNSNLDLYSELEIDILITGHTHYPMIKKLNNKLFLNPGSIGLPRDNGEYSSFMILDLLKTQATIYRTQYDISLLTKKCVPSETKLILNRRNKFLGTII